MEGNFRIVQEAEASFIIEKEFDTYEYKPICFLGLNLWQEKTPIRKWSIVDKKGDYIQWCRDHSFYRYKTIEESKKALEDIKKYPKVVDIEWLKQ